MGGVLEPLAAGSSRVWKDKSARNLTLVIDIGAGTTDFSLFWVVQNIQGEARRAFPVEPCGAAIRMAGDTLDSCLVQEVLNRANLGADSALRDRVSAKLFLGGVRRLKERLFTTGLLQESLADDRVVSITLDEFLQTKGVLTFSERVKDALNSFLTQIDASWKDTLDFGFSLVLTGGGCDLPMIKSLSEKIWNVWGTNFRFRLAKRIPDLIAEQFDANFAKEYPQLAVALGGALPMLLNERSSVREWKAGIHPPGPLTRYQTQGV